MATINELARISDVLLFEEGEEMNFVRDTITLASGGGACVVGQVLGAVTLGAASVAAGTNTGTGTLTMDSTTPILANAISGAYTVTILATGRAVVVDPRGVSLGEFEFSSGGTATFADRIKFALVDTSTHFVALDSFTVTIAAGSGKYKQVAPSATDGTQNAVAVCIVKADPTSADTTAVAITRGPVIFKSGGLVWTSGMTTPQKTAATAQLAALGMPTRVDYGV